MVAFGAYLASFGGHWSYLAAFGKSFGAEESFF